MQSFQLFVMKKRGLLESGRARDQVCYLS